MIVDIYLLYSFIRRLVTPFEEWSAYKDGTIDKNGKILVPRRQLFGKAKDNFGLFDLMILNMKKMISKLPGGATKLATFASALFLLKEGDNITDDNIDSMIINLPLIIEGYKKEAQMLVEDGAMAPPSTTSISSNSSNNIARKNDASTILGIKKKKKKKDELI